jgi:ornithine lipid ester-linked acyl 2-hydroxylase
MEKYIWDESEFPWLSTLTNNWESIKDYAVSIEDKFYPYREVDLYTGYWMVYTFIHRGKNLYRSDEFMHGLFDQLPISPYIASFSRLDPGTELHPHTGFTDEVIRFHLGLVCPENTAMKLNDDEYYWYPGKWFIFNDRVKHSVWNRGSGKRYILLMDFFKKDLWPSLY